MPEYEWSEFDDIEYLSAEVSNEAEELEALNAGVSVLYYKGAKMPKSTDPQLKPCPFCGRAVNYKQDFDGEHIIRCDSCAFQFSTYKARGSIIKKWNTRWLYLHARNGRKLKSSKVLHNEVQKGFMPELEIIQDRTD